MHWIAPSERDTATDTLEKRLWNAADQFRANSGLTAAQYSAPVLGLIFLLFAETRFAQRRAADYPHKVRRASEQRKANAFPAIKSFAASHVAESLPLSFAATTSLVVQEFSRGFHYPGTVGGRFSNSFTSVTVISTITGWPSAMSFR